MSKVKTLEAQLAKAQAKQEDWLTKAKKEEEKIKELKTQIALAKHEERSDYLAKHNLTWADVERQIESGNIKGELGNVPFNQPHIGQDDDLQE